MRPFLSHPSRKQLALWMRQFATMMNAGVPIVTALETLQARSSHKSLETATGLIIDTIQQGGSLAEGFARSRSIFSPATVSLIAAGERAGIVSESLEAICTDIEDRRALQSRLLRAMMYPAIVLMTLFIVILFLLLWVIPTFEELFSEANVTLPWLTQAVLSASRAAVNNWDVGAFVAFVVALLATVTLRKSETARSICQGLPFTTPCIKEIARKRYACECASLLASLLRAGIPVIQALEILSLTTHNRMVSSDLARAREDLLEGLSLTAALGRSPILPPMVSQMVGIGEASGRLDEMLSKTGSLFRAELEESLEVVKELAEPVLIVLIGVIVGTLIVAIYLPIFQMGEVSGFR
jgi:type IV pilus assembly protein PilC